MRMLKNQIHLKSKSRIGYLLIYRTVNFFNLYRASRAKSLKWIYDRLKLCANLYAVTIIFVPLSFSRILKFKSALLASHSIIHRLISIIFMYCLCALRLSKSQPPIFKILPRFHRYEPPSDSWIARVCDIFKCNCVIFMCFKIIIDPNSYFENLRILHLWEPLSDSSTACSTNIIESKCATFMCFKNIQNPRPYYSNSPDFSPRSFLPICPSAVFERSLSTTGLHLCAFYVLQEYPRPKPLFSKFPQIPL